MLRNIKTWHHLLLSSGLALWGCAGSDSDEARETTERSAHGQSGGEAPEDQDVQVFVGEVEDSDVQVAIVADGSRARVYFCGGPSSVANATHWFNLARSGDDLETQEQGFELRAQFEEDGVSGEFKPADDDASRLRFSSERVDSETIAGLYEGVDECGRIGLIVRQAGADAEPSAQGACVAPGRTPEQVNPITPLAREQGLVRVEAPGRDAQSVQLKAATLTPLTP